MLMRRRVAKTLGGDVPSQLGQRNSRSPIGRNEIAGALECLRGSAEIAKLFADEAKVVPRCRIIRVRRDGRFQLYGTLAILTPR